MPTGPETPLTTDKPLPMAIAPIPQLGMKVALGLEGFPSNRVIMVYGPPGGGKSSLLYELSNVYDSNKDEVWIVDAERAVDKIYFASYFKGSEADADEETVLKYYLKISEKLLKDQTKLSVSERELSEERLEILAKRIATIPIMLKELKETPEFSEVEKRTARSISRMAHAEYKLRKIRILQPNTMEEFEKEAMKLLEEKHKDPDRKHKRVLIGVDSINCLLPEDVLERAVSSEGSNFNAARYLHTFIPKLISKTAGTETTILVIHQKTTTIKMNAFERRSAIDDVATKGGSAAKFGATIMIGVEKGKKAEQPDGSKIDTGIIDIPKQKLRGGSRGNLKGTYYLRESIERSTLDFNEPLLWNIFTEEEMGIRKNRVGFFVPVELVKTHPDFEEKIKPRLRTYPKEENSEKLYITGEPGELMAFLLESRGFEEEVLLEYDILANT